MKIFKIKKIFTSLILGLFLFLLFSLPNLAQAQTANPGCGNVHVDPSFWHVVGTGLGAVFSPPDTGSTNPNEILGIICTPQPRVTIPGLNFTSQEDFQSLVEVDANGDTYFNIPFFGQYLAAVYRYSVAAISVIAVVVIIFSGVQWMLPTGSDNVAAAKKRIISAITGLMLAVGSYVILYTINPELVQFKSLKVLYIKGVPIENADDESLFDTETVGSNLSSSEITQLLANGLPEGPIATESGNPIPQLIGPKPANLANCSMEAAIYTAEHLLTLNICVGPCHCAYTVSRFLDYIGCSIPYSGMANGIVEHAIAAGWQNHLLSEYFTGEDEKNMETTPPFGILYFDMGDGTDYTSANHVGISLGNGKVFQSGSGQAATELLEAYSCTGKFSQTNANDPTKNCAPCARIPRESPITGNFAGNTRRSIPGNNNSPMIPNINLNGQIGQISGSCEGNQFWTISDLKHDTNLDWTWDGVALPN